MAHTLPATGPVERYAALRAVLDKQGFLDALPGVAVLIRLDERGGDDEPAPWAFHGAGLPFPVDVPVSQEGDVFLSIERSEEEARASGKRKRPRKKDESIREANPEEMTATGPTFSLSIPAARGRATVHVVPRVAEAIIGRARECDVCVAERSVSKRHARLLVESTRVSGKRKRPPSKRPPARPIKPHLVVVDLGSQNGIAVNGKKVAKAGQDAIRSGDVLDLGDVSLLLLDALEFWEGLPRLADG